MPAQLNLLKNNVGTTELFAISFGVWAGVVGLGVRYIVFMLRDISERVRLIELDHVRLQGECK